ncbi:MAG TPA: hypothetical protein VKR55_02925 [Bradyrhizobium sp.]|uniref:hypothetical protein n=1 Tax=Bradyrhizobium sp. TaxID=376 RepID=UPI002C233040|nr:hypothetical protein [Bradyrhizobium sp.]HLZ01085.1 hypothetical protein [Bradyrhizobium sp.]
MDRRMALEHLATTEKGIALGERHIAREEQMIADLDRAGADTKLALAVLATYRQTQAEHVAHRNRLLKMLREPCTTATIPLPGRYDPAGPLPCKGLMSVDPDDLSAVVRYALESTHATAICPFHSDVRVRVGDDAAESHAWARARNIVKSDGKKWKAEVLTEEFGQQLSKAADGYCPQCRHDNLIDPRQ